MCSPKRVLWISRHTMTAAQRADLERVMGGAVELTPWTDTVEDVRSLLPRIARVDAVAAVLPLEKLAGLIKLAHGGPARRAAGEGVRLRASRLAADPGGHHPRTGAVTPPPRAARRAGRETAPKNAEKTFAPP